MIGYSAENIFTQSELELHRQATTFVSDIPNDLGFEVRCHELVRAVAVFLEACRPRLHIVDGHFGAVEHSWLVALPEAGFPGYRHIILDVYAVGSLPLVQLIEAGSLGIRDARDYREGATRDDINPDHVTAILIAHSKLSGQYR